MGVGGELGDTYSRHLDCYPGHISPFHFVLWSPRAFLDL